MSTSSDLKRTAGHSVHWDRWCRVLQALADFDEPGGGRLCAMSARALAVSGAGITVLTEAGVHPMTVCCSDRVAQKVEDLQFSLGEGPCIDAFHRDRPVREPDLASAGRWPGFTPGAVAIGVGAIFGFPLRVRRHRIGALNLYQDRVGDLSGEQFADALVVADVVARQMLVLQSGAATGGLPEGLLENPERRWVVHQASGMISAQLEIQVEEALVRLRAHAYGNGREVDVVAADVVERRLRLDEA